MRFGLQNVVTTHNPASNISLHPCQCWIFLDFVPVTLERQNNACSQTDTDQIVTPAVSCMNRPYST